MVLARWKIISVSLLVLLGIVFALPNVLPTRIVQNLPSWLPHKTLSLGLDLRGGSYLLLGLDQKTVIQDHLTTLLDDVRQTLRREKIPYQFLKIEGDELVVAPKNPADKINFEDKLSKLAKGMQINEEGDGFRIGYSEDQKQALIKQVLEQSIEVVRRRIDETGTKEPIIQRQGQDRILIQLPGVEDPEEMKAILGQTAKLTFHFVDSSVKVKSLADPVPSGRIVVEDADQPGVYHVITREAALTGDLLTNAKPDVDPMTRGSVVNFNLNREGALRFGRLTTENVGKQLAIVLDNKVITAPVIEGPITGGSGQIRGRFSLQDANNLAILLRAGALPTPLTVLEERSVGPSLGADSIRDGELASLYGFLFVLAFMVICYGFFGMIANIALILNLIFLMAIMTIGQFTLTLPGIAGIVLTLGMAVDANVLIFERIRDEIRNGKTPFMAIETGHKHAIATIIDANVTTFIAAFILYALGTGPIKGFAVTLSIGLLTSMFTAVTITHMMVVAWIYRTKPKKLEI